MKRVRRLSLGGSVALMVLGVIILLNFTAKNPTGRRYASEPVISIGNAQEIGLSAERVLEKDLRQPRNDDPDQRQCICNSPSYANPAQCRVCIAYSQSIANHRRPDFVTANYIAEVKNRRELLYTQSDLVNQIGDYAIAARALGVPLWVYVRPTTRIAPEYRRIVRTTGGDVVPYLVGPDYSDGWDRVGWYLLAVGSGFGILMSVWEWGTGYATKRSQSPPHSPSEPDDEGSEPPADEVKRASRSVDYMDDFVRRTREKSRRTIDEEDSRDDFSTPTDPEDV